jgi:drug/metabolite transporter (DMT)-like permease
MGKYEQPEQFQPKAGTAESHLGAIAQELQTLRQTLVGQLSQDIRQLQARKTRLQREVEDLELQQREQIAQQQRILRQIAPALIDEIQQILRQQLQQASVDAVSLDEHTERTHKLVNSLDSTLRSAFQSLEQDIGSYQSSLYNRLSQMHSLEKQGEVLLDALVEKLQAEFPPQSESQPQDDPPPPPKKKLIIPETDPALPTSPTPAAERPQQMDTTSTETASQRTAGQTDTHFQGQPQRHTPPPEPIGNVTTSHTTPQARQSPPYTKSRPVFPVEPKPSPPPGIARKRKASDSKLGLGFTFVLLSAFALSVYNIIIHIILNGASVLGLFQFEQLLPPGFGNALLILWLRMLVVVPLMTGLASILYPKTWQDIVDKLDGRNWQLWLRVTGSGAFLFLSQVFIYLALGSRLSPGEVITLFFIFPIVTVLFSWLFFGERPSVPRGSASIVVFIGVLLSSLSAGSGMGNFSWYGVMMAVISGITFAFYVLLTQVCAKQLHPVPFSLVNFCTILVLSGLSFLLPPVRESVNVASGNWFGLIVSGLILGGLTLISYLLNNIGISIVGAARASVFGAIAPALTSILAWLLIGSALSLSSLMGMIMVTIGVFALSWERLRSKPKSSKASS